MRGVRQHIGNIVITDISEFSFGFALTNELIDVYKLASHGAPTFPTQAQEGKAGGGYDVKLPGAPVFIQFKRSAALRRKNALDAKYFGLPYYRFQIMASSHSQQHQLLLDLESRGNIVYYAAPIFSKPHELDRYFLRKSVRHNTLFLKPRTIGVIGDSKAHTISFSGFGQLIYRSEPVYLNRDELSFEPEQKIAASEDYEEPRTRRKFIEELVDIYSKRRRYEDAGLEQSLREPAEDRDPMQHLAYLARNLYGCELIYV